MSEVSTNAKFIYHIINVQLNMVSQNNVYRYILILILCRYVYIEELYPASLTHHTAGPCWWGADAAAQDGEELFDL